MSEEPFSRRGTGGSPRAAARSGPEATGEKVHQKDDAAEPYDRWAARQQSDLLADVGRHRKRQRAWNGLALGFLVGDVVAAAVYWDVLTSPDALRGQLLAAWGWLSALLFLALVASTVAIWHQTRIRDDRYLLALLGSERGELIRNIVDAQTGKPAVEVDRGLWQVVDGELVRVEAPREPVQEKKATES